MSERDYHAGETVRVLVTGKFYDQRVKILDIRKRGSGITYKLDTTWDGKPYPCWFKAAEFESEESEDRS